MTTSGVSQITWVPEEQIISTARWMASEGPICFHTSLGVGCIIGTGIFTSLGFQLNDIQSGFALLMLWVIGGIAALCGARHWVADVTDLFRREVIDPFVAEYAGGRTPNPCLACNARVRFPELVRLADRLGAVRPDTKMIFMSGRAAEVISDAGVLIPVDAFVAKPFTVERLLNKVRERLEYRSPFSRPR